MNATIRQRSRPTSRTSRHVRRLVALVVLASAGLVTPVLATRPASALTDVERVIASSTRNSQPSKSQSAACPAGKVVVGGGGIAGGASASVHLAGFRPRVNLSGNSVVQVRADEAETGFDGNWAVFAYITCAPAPAGWEIVSESSDVSSDATRTATVDCPPGKMAVAFGGWTDGPTGQIHLTGAFPTPGLTGVTATAAEDLTGTVASWTVTAYAVCVTPLRHVVLLHTASPGFNTDGPNGAGMAIDCSIGSKSLLGIGIRITGVTAQAIIQEVTTAGDPPVKAYLTTNRDAAAPATSGSFRIEAFLICD
jgi:hypothetical protein